MVFFEILLRHISDSGVYIAIIFSMVIEYLFMICSSVIFDKNILFQTRTPELSIWEHVDQPWKLSRFDPKSAFADRHTAFIFSFWPNILSYFNSYPCYFFVRLTYNSNKVMFSCICKQTTQCRCSTVLVHSYFGINYFCRLAISRNNLKKKKKKISSIQIKELYTTK